MTDISEHLAGKIHKHLAAYPLRSYDSGQIVLYANENPSHIFFLVSGKVRMYDVSLKGNEVVINVYEPGRFFPLGWALNQTPNRYFFKAEAASQLRLIPPEESLAFIVDNPDVTLDLLRRIYQKTDRVFERMVYLMSATATRRLIYELVAECRKFGKVQSDDSCILLIREIELAGRSGLSRETVSREIQKLKEQGFICAEKHGIRIYDLNHLEAQVGAIP